MTFRLEPGEYRFVTGGYEGSGLSMQDVDMDASIHLDNYVEMFSLRPLPFYYWGWRDGFSRSNLLNRFSREV